MSKCPGVHCPGCGDGGGWGLLVGLAATGAAVWLVMTYLWVIGVAVGVTLAAVAGVMVWMARRGAAAAVVSAPRSLAAPARPALTARPVLAIEAPRPPSQTVSGVVVPRTFTKNRP